MTALQVARELTVAEAAKRGVAGMVTDAKRGEVLVVTRHQRPVAVVVGASRMAEFDEAAADLRDLARGVADSGRRTSLDDVLTAFGHTRESLAAVG